MSGPRISVVVHDGSRILDRRRIGHEAKDQTAMEITKSFYQTEVVTYKGLGDEVVAIGDLKKGKDQGFQLYLAVEVGGKVVEMGLPFIKNKSGEDLFLSPSNIKPGDLEAIAPNLPAGAEILMVWRLDKGMNQDIVVTNDSIISSVAPPPALGADYSMLDKKACISCGGGASSRFDFVVDVMEVKLFCGGQDDPIRMSTLLVPAPETFKFDAIRIADHARHIDPGMERSQDSQNRLSPGNVIADIFARTSWEDSMKIGESFLSTFSVYYNRQVADPRTAQQVEPIRSDVKQFDAGTTIVLFRMPKEKGAPNPATPTLNPSERRLWLGIHAREEASRPMEKPRNIDLRPNNRSPSHALLEGVQKLKEVLPAVAANPQVKARPLHLHLSLQAVPVQGKIVIPEKAQTRAIPPSKETSKKAGPSIPDTPKVANPKRTPAPNPSLKPASPKTRARGKARKEAKPPDATVQKPKRRSTKSLQNMELKAGIAKVRKGKIQKSVHQDPKVKTPEGSIPKANPRKDVKARIRKVERLIPSGMPKRQASHSISKKKAGKITVHLFNEMMGIHAHSSKTRNSKGKARRG